MFREILLDEDISISSNLITIYIHIYRIFKEILTPPELETYDITTCCMFTIENYEILDLRIVLHSAPSCCHRG